MADGNVVASGGATLRAASPEQKEAAAEGSDAAKAKARRAAQIESIISSLLNSASLGDLKAALADPTVMEGLEHNSTSQLVAMLQANAANMEYVQVAQEIQKLQLTTDESKMIIKAVKESPSQEHGATTTVDASAAAHSSTSTANPFGSTTETAAAGPVVDAAVIATALAKVKGGAPAGESHVVTTDTAVSEAPAIPLPTGNERNRPPAVELSAQVRAMMEAGGVGRAK